MVGPKDMSKSKAKILAYKLGNPKTYTPIHNFPVTSRFVPAPVIPKPRQTVFFNWKAAESKGMQSPEVTTTRRSNVKTVRKPRAYVKHITVRVCECGEPISPMAKQCRQCYDKGRATDKRVCPICAGTKGPQAKQCRSCQIEERKARGWTT